MNPHPARSPLARSPLPQWAAAVAAALMLLLPGLASAQAHTTTAVNLRAGPGVSYPIVTWLPAGVRVQVLGCLDGFQWCDVIASNYRGWVHAGFLAYPYRGQPVPVIRYGALIGLPLLTFSLIPYWDAHYRHQPWYAQRPRWADRPPRPRPRPPVPPPGQWSGPGHRPGDHRPGPGPGYRPPPPQPPAARPPIVRPPAMPPGRPPAGIAPPHEGRPGMPAQRPPSASVRPPGAEAPNAWPPNARPPTARPP
ncbi:MAG: SH3 domain-containing protein, partial [Burkholderiaceae bacterium]